MVTVGIVSVVGIISVVIGGHFGGGDHFDGGDHFGGGTVLASCRFHRSVYFLGLFRGTNLDDRQRPKNQLANLQSLKF